MNVLSNSLSPHGESGLKFLLLLSFTASEASLPARGEWIEICYIGSYTLRLGSLPARGEWIKSVITQNLIVSIFFTNVDF